MNDSYSPDSTGSTSVIQKLREKYYRDKADFFIKQYSMSVDEIIMNNVLLKVEEDAYFNRFRSETHQQMATRQEKEFIGMFGCCNLSFNSFNEFFDHKAIFHERYQTRDSYRAAGLSKNTEPPPIKLTPTNEKFSLESKYVGNTNLHSEANHCHNNFQNTTNIAESHNYKKDIFGIVSPERVIDENYDFNYNLDSTLPLNHSLATSKNLNYPPLSCNLNNKNVLFTDGNRQKGSKRVFRCTIKGCIKEYTSAYGLKYHLGTNHDISDKDKPYKCPNPGCPKTYKNSNGLKYHMRVSHSQNL